MNASPTPNRPLGIFLAALPAPLIFLGLFSWSLEWGIGGILAAIIIGDLLLVMLLSALKKI